MEREQAGDDVGDHRVQDDLRGAAAAMLDLVLAARLDHDPEFAAVARELAARTDHGDGEAWWDRNDARLPPSPYARLRAAARSAGHTRLEWLASLVRGHAAERIPPGRAYGPPTHQVSAHLPIPLDDWATRYARATRRSRRDVLEEAVARLPAEPARLDRLVRVVDDTWLVADVPTRHVCLRVGQACRQQIDQLVGAMREVGRPVTLRRVAATGLAHLQLQVEDG